MDQETVRMQVEDVLARHLRVVSANPDGGIVDGGGACTYAVLGPVPLPVTLSDGHAAVFQWTTFAQLHPEVMTTAGLDTDPALTLPATRLALLRALSSNRGEWPQSVLTFGDFQRAERPLVRIHSNCATGDVFGSRRCECGPQLRSAFDQVAQAGAGAVIYLADHEGRGIGLFAKAAAYLLQDRGLDTYEANRALGFGHDTRKFEDAAFILNLLRGAGRSVRLLSNNPEKRRAMMEVGIKVVELTPLVTGLTHSNLRYMKSKRAHGHILPEDLLHLDIKALPVAI